MTYFLFDKPIRLGFSFAYFWIKEKALLVLLLLLMVVFLGIALFHLLKRYWARVKDTDKIYEAKLVKVNFSFPHRTRYSIVVAFKDENGEQVNAETDYIFNQNYVIMMQDSNGFKIAHKPDGEAIILEIL